MSRRIALLIALLLLVAGAWACQAFDVRGEQYEDGSGRIVWCVPLAPCSLDWED
jgi:hypothetical protein